MTIMNKIFLRLAFLNCHILNEFNLLCHAQGTILNFVRLETKTIWEPTLRKVQKMGIESSKVPTEKGLKALFINS